MKTFILGRSKEEVGQMIPDKHIRKVQLGGTQICVARDGDEYFAFETQCPHRKAELSQGFINGIQEIVCPLHQYRFDMRTGSVANGQCPDLKVYKTRITEDGLEIGI